MGVRRGQHSCPCDATRGERAFESIASHPGPPGFRRARRPVWRPCRRAQNSALANSRSIALPSSGSASNFLRFRRFRSRVASAGVSRRPSHPCTGSASTKTSPHARSGISFEPGACTADDGAGHGSAHPSTRIKRDSAAGAGQSFARSSLLISACASARSRYRSMAVRIA